MRRKQSFLTTVGLYEDRYEFKVMPFEAMNVPATFQRLMDDRVLERSNSAPMFGIYIMWMILLIFAKSFDKSSRTPRKCFSVRLREACIKLKPTKCRFEGDNEVDY